MGLERELTAYYPRGVFDTFPASVIGMFPLAYNTKDILAVGGVLEYQKQLKNLREQQRLLQAQKPLEAMDQKGKSFG